MNNIPSIILTGADATAVPDWFKRRLRDIDLALVCYFNPYKNQFVIDRCAHGSDCLSSDHVSCPKMNVMLFPHIGEAALEKLKGMDSWAKFKTLDAFHRDAEQLKADWDAKAEASVRDDYKHAALDNRTTLLKTYDLIKQHDLSRPAHG